MTGIKAESAKNTVARKNEKTQEGYQKLRSQSKPVQGAYILQDMKQSEARKEESLSAMLRTQKCFKSDHLDQIKKLEIAQKTGKVRRILRAKPIETL